MQTLAYVPVKTIGEAAELLSQLGEAARIIAGGTDILVQLRAGRRQQIHTLVDIKAVPEMNALSFSPQNGLTIGGAVPCYRIYEDPMVQKNYPGIVDAASLVGSIQIQGRATLGGNICNAVPSGDTIPPLIALGATCNIVGTNGSHRELPNDAKVDRWSQTR